MQGLVVSNDHYNIKRMSQKRQDRRKIMYHRVVVGWDGGFYEIYLPWEEAIFHRA